MADLRLYATPGGRLVAAMRFSGDHVADHEALMDWAAMLDVATPAWQVPWSEIDIYLLAKTRPAGMPAQAITRGTAAGTWFVHTAGETPVCLTTDDVLVNDGCNLVVVYGPEFDRCYSVEHVHAAIEGLSSAVADATAALSSVADTIIKRFMLAYAAAARHMPAGTQQRLMAVEPGKERVARVVVDGCAIELVAAPRRRGWTARQYRADRRRLDRQRRVLRKLGQP